MEGAISITFATGLKALAGTRAKYYGVSVRETGGLTDAVLKIFDGVDATGQIIEDVVVGKGTSLTAVFTHHIRVTSGSIFIAVTGGTLEGAIRVG